MSEDPKTPIANSFWNKINSKGTPIGKGWSGSIPFLQHPFLTLCPWGWQWPQGWPGSCLQPWLDPCFQAGRSCTCAHFMALSTPPCLGGGPWPRAGLGAGAAEPRVTAGPPHPGLVLCWHPPASAWVLPSGSFGWNGNGAGISHGHEVPQAASSTSSGVKGRSC